MNPYEGSGPARGLIARVRAGTVARAGRDLLAGQGPDRLMPAGCRWCGQPTGSTRKWHGECVRWYLAARGRTVYVGTPVSLCVAHARAKRPLPVLTCAECGGRHDETDHHVALSVARELRDRADPRWWRAWTPGNLRPLCRGCHAEKTTTDRALLGRLRGLRKG